MARQSIRRVFIPPTYRRACATPRSRGTCGRMAVRSTARGRGAAAIDSPRRTPPGDARVAMRPQGAAATRPFAREIVSPYPRRAAVPPSIGITAPVMNAASSDARNAASAATSSALAEAPERDLGELPLAPIGAAIVRARTPSERSVSMKPGQIGVGADARAPRSRARSIASARPGRAWRRRTRSGSSCRRRPRSRRC